MRSSLCLIVVCVTGTALRLANGAEVKVKPPPPVSTGMHFTAERVEQRRAWLERTMGQPFAQRAKGRPWEAEAQAFVSAAFERWQPRSIYENDAELAARGSRLCGELKCDDPLVRLLAARLKARASFDAFWHWQGISDQMGLFRNDVLLAAGQLERALNELEHLSAARGFLSVVVNETGQYQTWANDEGRCKALREYGVLWLRESLTDGSYVIPGPDEVLLMENALGDSSWSTVFLWDEKLHTALEGAPLSEWAKLVFLGAGDWAKGQRLRRSGGDEKPDYQAAGQKFFQSWKLNPASPFAPYLALSIGWYGDSPGGASRQEWFDRAVAAQFDWYPPYDRYITWLRPDWTGSIEDESAFARSCIATGRFDTAVPLYFVDALKTIRGSSDWRSVARLPENGVALLELGRGMVAEPSRHGQQAMWKSLAAVWAWMGGKDRESADLLSALPDGRLHPMAMQELRYFRVPEHEMRGELVVRLSPAKEDYEKGEAHYLEHRLAEARAAFAAALAAIGEDAAGKTWLQERLAVTDFEIEAKKGEWLKVPLEVALWDVAAGKWTNSADGSLVLEGEERAAFARFKGRVGVDWEMRGEYSFAVPDGAPRHPELGLAFRNRSAYDFLQCFTWQDGDQLACRLDEGIWTPRIDQYLPEMPAETRIPLTPTTRFFFKTDARHITLEINGEKVWDNVVCKLRNLALEDGRIGFAAREPGARNRMIVRSLEIRRLPATLVREPGTQQ